MTRFTFMIINFMLFHTCWMATAYGAGYGWYWLGPTFVVPAVVIHLSLIGDWIRESVFLSLVSVIGYSMNSTLHNLGYILYQDTNPERLFAPFWMFFLWLVFASLFHGCLLWLRGRMMTQFVLGVVLGPFAYVSAETLGALKVVGGPYTTYPVLSITWGLLIPLLSWLAFESELFSKIEHATVSAS